MDKIKQRIKIAEICGAKWYSIDWYGQPKKVLSFGFPTQNSLGPMRWELKDGRILAPDILDYLNSLDAMAEVEKLIKYDEIEQEKYQNMLLKVICKQFGYHGANQLIHASAAQRAEAFLRYKFLWEDENN